jgi:hypothetical protein
VFLENKVVASSDRNKYLTRDSWQRRLKVRVPVREKKHVTTIGSAYKIIAQMPNHMISEFKYETWATLREFAARLILPVIIGFVIVLSIGIVILALFNTGFFFMVIVLYLCISIPIVLGEMLGVYNRQFFVDKERREVHITTLRHFLKERHVTVPFDRIEFVEFDVVKAQIVIVSMVVKRPSSEEFFIFMGPSSGTIADFKAYLQDLFFQVEFSETLESLKHTMASGRSRPDRPSSD